MEQPLLRLLIQEKLADGRLPHTPIPRAQNGAGNGQTCDGCGETVTNVQTVMGNLVAAGSGLQFHVACFDVWDVERQAYGREPSVRLPARSAFRPPAPDRTGHGRHSHRQPARPTRPLDARGGCAQRLNGMLALIAGRGPRPGRRRDY